jgi:hypothetical protein
MVTIEAAQARAARYFDANYRQWAAEVAADLMANGRSPSDYAGLPLLGYSVPLHSPTEQEVLAHPREAREWVQSWRASRYSANLAWVTREWSSVGRQDVPDRLVVANADELAILARCTSVWKPAKARSLALGKQWASQWQALLSADSQAGQGQGDIQAIAAAIAKTVSRLCQLPEADWDTLLMVLDWLLQNPHTQVYVRQLPIRGIDSKWFEQHKGVIEPLYTALTGQTGLGFLRIPHQYRVRFLDMALAPGMISDMSLSPAELGLLPATPAVAFICENLVSTLAFPHLPQAVAIHGGGYAVGALTEAEWLKHVPVLYWGDLDSNGFAILNHLRHHHPDVTSLLMDADTLALHQGLCVPEDKPNRGALDRLTPHEQATLDLLMLDGGALRLEQERIEWSWALARIDEAYSYIQDRA